MDLADVAEARRNWVEREARQAEQTRADLAENMQLAKRIIAIAEMAKLVLDQVGMPRPTKIDDRTNLWDVDVEPDGEEHPHGIARLLVTYANDIRPVTRRNRFGIKRDTPEIYVTDEVSGVEIWTGIGPMLWPRAISPEAKFKQVSFLQKAVTEGRVERWLINRSFELELEPLRLVGVDEQLENAEKTMSLVARVMDLPILEAATYPALDHAPAETPQD